MHNHLTLTSHHSTSYEQGLAPICFLMAKGEKEIEYSIFLKKKKKKDGEKSNLDTLDGEKFYLFFFFFFLFFPFAFQ